MDTRPSSRKAWLWLVGGALALILIALAFWFAYQHFLQPHDFEEAGFFGPATMNDSTGLTFIKSPYWEKGDRVVLSGFLEYPGKLRGPAYLVLLRKTDQHKELWANEVGSGGNSKVHLNVGFNDSKKQVYWVKFELSFAPVTEQLNLGERSYALEDGRLFLVDLCQQPTTVTQLKQDLSALLPKHDAQKEDLQKAVEKLQEKSDSVRQFWQNK